MKTSIIIPTVGRTFFAYNMVVLLLAGTCQADEIIIVDQTGPKDRNPFAFAELKKLEAEGKCLIVEQTVKSLTVARNVGIKHCSAELLIFVDDDAFIPGHFVEAYVNLFADPRIDAATGMILVGESDNGTIDTTQSHPSVHDGHTMLRGGNFAVRRSVILSIGGLDENFVGAANYEDADLAFRLHEKGCHVVWSPLPWLFHLSYPSGGGRINNPLSHENFAYNLFYFHLRHYRHIKSSTLLGLLRWRVFNKETVSRPWRLLPRLRDFIVGYRRARAMLASGPKLPLKGEG